MKKIFLLLVIITSLCGSSKAADPELKTKEAQKAAARFEELVKMAMRGVGYGPEKDTEECAEEISLHRRHYMKELARYDKYYSEHPEARDRGKFVPEPYVLPCRTKD